MTELEAGQTVPVRAESGTEYVEAKVGEHFRTATGGVIARVPFDGSTRQQRRAQKRRDDRSYGVSR